MFNSPHLTLSRLVMLGLAVAALGAGCASSDKNADTKTPEKSATTPVAPAAAEAPGLLPSGEGAPVDEDFTAGSEYMRETPERFADLNGKKPFVMYFYADWSQDSRTLHPELVVAFNAKKFGMPMLRVNLKDNQVTDEGVEWAKTFNVTSTDTFIVMDSSGKEVTRFTGHVDEAKLLELMAKGK